MAKRKIYVNNFYGGVNKLMSPHLLKINQSVELKNINIQNGSLERRYYNPSEVIISTSDNIKYYNNGDIVDLGAASSSNKYKGAKILRYEDNFYIMHSNVPKAIYEDELLPTKVTKPSGSQSVSTSAISSNNINWRHYTYYVTRINEKGFESPLKKLSQIQEYYINNSGAPEQSEVTFTYSRQDDHNIVLYRIGGTDKQPARVLEVIKGSGEPSSSDIITNATITEKSGSTSIKFRCNEDQAEILRHRPAKTNPPGNFTYFTAGRLGLAASGRDTGDAGLGSYTLYLSIGRPDAWETLRSLRLSSKITGLTSTDRGILAFTTSNHLYHITGYNLDDLLVTIINEDVGCSSHRTICKMRGGQIVWVFDNNLYMFDGRVTNLTQGKYKIELTTNVNALSDNNKYILCTSTGILVMDFDIEGFPIIEYDLSGGGDYYNIQHYLKNDKYNIGYYKENNSFWGLETVDQGDQDDNLGIYKSPDFVAQTHDDEAKFISIDIVHKGQVSVSISVNDNEVVTDHEIDNDTKGVSRVYLPNREIAGNYISVKFKIHKVVYSYSINFDATPII